MDKITEALKKILPGDQVSEVAKAVEDMMAEQVKSLEAEFQAKLDEAYQQFTDEKTADEAVAEQGYKQAYDIINGLMKKLDEQRQEFEAALEEGFEEAFQEIQKEKGKNENVEVELYEEFDKKLKEMQDFMVDKMDQFLSLQEAEMYEHALRQVQNDPQVAEDRVVVAKMADLLAAHVDNESICGAATAKMEQAHKAIEELKGQLRIVEARNVKLSAQNSKLNEQVREANNLLTEATKVERKERASKVKNASGRGQRVADQVIAEYAATPKDDKKGQELTEGSDPLSDLLVLSGLEER
jgi:hypothetical protein